MPGYRGVYSVWILWGEEATGCSDSKGVEPYALAGFVGDY